MYFDDDELDLRPPRRRRFFSSRRAVLPPRVENEDDYVPSPEDFLPSPPKVRGPLSQKPDTKYLRPALVMFALFFAASFVHWSNPGASPFSASYDQVFVKGEWWRLFTALFTHADLDHLASNTPLFLVFGWFLHAYFRRLVFPLAASVVGALSNALTIWTYDPRASLVGASGMLYGMVALWLVLYVRFDTDRAVPMRIFRAAGVSIMLLFPTTFHAQTSYMAHAAGFGIGILAGALLAPFVRVRSQLSPDS